jgi:hypothetical protein
VYIHKAGGGLANMDTDLDGVRPRGDNPDDSQSTTTFQDLIRSYNVGIKDLHPYIHPYVVFGNEGTKSGYKQFSPTKYGIKPLSVMAVVCNNKLVS